MYTLKMFPLRTSKLYKLKYKFPLTSFTTLEKKSKSSQIKMIVWGKYVWKVYIKIIFIYFIHISLHVIIYYTEFCDTHTKWSFGLCKCTRTYPLIKTTVLIICFHCNLPWQRQTPIQICLVPSCPSPWLATSSLLDKAGSQWRDSSLNINYMV